MSSIRQKRMEKELKKLISNVVSLQLQDSLIQHVTITAIKLSADFSVAKIYFTDLSENKQETVLKALQKTAGFIKNEIAKAKMMRIIPELIFFYDEVEENAQKLDKIFQKIHGEK